MWVLKPPASNQAISFIAEDYILKKITFLSIGPSLNRAQSNWRNWWYIEQWRGVRRGPGRWFFFKIKNFKIILFFSFYLVTLSRSFSKTIFYNCVCLCERECVCVVLHYFYILSKTKIIHVFRLLRLYFALSLYRV